MQTLGYSIFANFSEWDIIEWDITLDEVLCENSVQLLINSLERSKEAYERDLHTLVNFQNGILMQQHKFPYRVKLIDFMRILSVAVNAVNEIHFMNAYKIYLLLTTNNLICPCRERDSVLVIG